MSKAEIFLEQRYSSTQGKGGCSWFVTFKIKSFWLTQTKQTLRMQGQTLFNANNFYLLLVPPNPEAVLVPEEDEEPEDEEGLGKLSVWL